MPSSNTTATGDADSAVADGSHNLRSPQPAVSVFTCFLCLCVVSINANGDADSTAADGSHNLQSPQPQAHAGSVFVGV